MLVREDIELEGQRPRSEGLNPLAWMFSCQQQAAIEESKQGGVQR